MRAYVTAPIKGANVPEGKKILPAFSANQTDASAAKKAMQEDYGLKRTEVATTDVDIPTSKSDLIPWLNGWVKKTFG